MSDLTQGSIPRHLVRLAAPLAAGMVFQTLYYLVDLYFVARLGDAAIAGVATAGNVQFIVMALTQVLGVGTMALIAHAMGRRDHADANLIFNQGLVLAGLAALLTLVGGLGFGGRYVASLGADPATVAAGKTYLYWFLPGLALQFAMVTMGSALRGTGIVKPTMIVQVATVLINAALAPVLIAGWLTGKPLGVAGAGLATTLAILIGVVLMWLYFERLEKAVAVDRRLLRPDPRVWGRILRIGLPTGGEFALMFVHIGVVYWIIRDFGAAAQAGYGLGSRIMQAIFLPAMAIAFATAPLAGQNFGAGRYDRVRETFRAASILGTAIMVVITIACRWRPELFFTPFTREAEVVAVGAGFLSFVAWNFVASGLVFTCSGMFQALGNTVPSLISSSGRMILFVIPAVWLSGRPGFALTDLWMVSVVTVAIQAAFSLWLLRLELRRRLGSPAPVVVPVPPTLSPEG
ncbi:MAG: MATE family efflux transporter [Gemmatimonadetes bacterium]|nr:MATE family efflux transporter [Gemmatimonadota bacterium]MCC7131160.1 MATE family efflux transporter [Gemmatimonadales bacterium]